MDNHLYIKDVRSHLTDITSSDFFVLMGRDAIFCDYFNKFCSLPIFGQRITYSRKRQKFLFDPPPPSARRREKLSLDSVRYWLFRNRFPNFVNSRASDEYKLSVLLSYFSLGEKMKQELPKDLSEAFSCESFTDEFSDDIRQFQMEHFGKVSKMAKFREFVSESRYGRHVISFWMDAEQLRRVLRQYRSGEDVTDDEYRRHQLRLLLGAIQTKYYRMTSRFCLPENFMFSGLPDPMKRNCRAYGTDFTLHLQEQVLNRLQEYWLPKYIIHICRLNVIQQADNKTKKLSVCFDTAMFLDFNDAVKLLEYAMRRSSMVRYLDTVIDHQPPTSFQMDNDEENILLQNETKNEIWNDTKGPSQEMLGVDDIDFIHKHLFEDNKTKDVRSEYAITTDALKQDSSTGSVVEEQLESLKAEKSTIKKYSSKSERVTFNIDTSTSSEDVYSTKAQSELSPTNDRRLSATTSSFSNAASSCGYEGDDSSGQEVLDTEENAMDVKKRKTKHKRKQISSSGSDSIKTISPNSQDPFVQKSSTLPIYPYSDISATPVEIKRSASATLQSLSRESLTGQTTNLDEKISRYRRIHYENNASSSVQIESLFDSPLARMDQEVDHSDLSLSHISRSSVGETSIPNSTMHLPSIAENDSLDRSLSAPNRRSHCARFAVKKSLSADNGRLPSVTSEKGMNPLTTMKGSDSRHVSSSTSSDSSSSIKTLSSSSGDSQSYFITRSKKDSSTSTTTTGSSKANWAGDGVELEEDSEDEEERSVKRNEWQRAFSEILLADELSGFAYRSFLSMENRQEECEDEQSRLRARLDPAFVACFGDIGTRTRNLLKQRSDKEHQRSLVVALDLWRDVEELRRVHACRDAHEISEKFEAILRTYVYSEVLLNHFGKFADLGRTIVLYFQSLTLDNDQPFPVGLLTLQNELQMVLESDWIVFAAEDKENFQNAVMPMYWKIGRKRNSFPSCSLDIRSVPFLGYMSNHNEEMTDQVEQAKTSAGLGTLSNFLGYNGQGQSAYRASRAVNLLLMSARAATQAVGGFYSNDYDGEIGAEVESDDDGGMPPLPPKRYAILPELDTKLLSTMSAKEYPRFGLDYTKCKVVRTVQRHRTTHRPMYLRPIRKQGNVFQRPTKKPKNLLEILRDPLHFMFFKRYMSHQNSEAPVLFWKSVDLLKRTEQAISRQAKAKAIMKKFFGRLAGGGVLLQCDDDLIKEIAQVETVTTSMLVEAQTLVYISMEKNWGQKYASTFPYDPNDEEEADKTIVNNLAKTRPWKVFGDFIRRGARFIRSMRSPEKFQEFRRFLIKVPLRVDERAAGDASSSDNLLRKVIYKQQNMELENKITIQEVLGRKVVLEFLPNDLALWFEVDRFQVLLKNEQMLLMAGCHDDCDSDVVKEKAKTIVDCFIDSSIPPKLRINMESDSAQNIIAEFAKGAVDRPLFHKAVLCTFPLLLHYWRIFCLDKFRYVSKKTLRALRRAKVIRNRIDSEKRKRARNIPLTYKLPDISESEKNIPDYIKGLLRKRSPYHRVKGIVVDDPPTLHFSLEHGLKFILPPKRALHLNIKAKEDKEEQDEDAFLSVWTRGAKMVNVIRAGSDPKLLSLRQADAKRTVKCDLLDF